MFQTPACTQRQQAAQAGLTRLAERHRLLKAQCYLLSRYLDSSVKHGFARVAALLDGQEVSSLQQKALDYLNAGLLIWHLWNPLSPLPRLVLQLRVAELVAAGKNVFFTGNAGTGNSIQA